MSLETLTVETEGTNREEILNALDNTAKNFYANAEGTVRAIPGSVRFSTSAGGTEIHGEAEYEFAPAEVSTKVTGAAAFRDSANQ